MPYHTTPGALVADLNWKEIGSRVQSGAIGVLPVGAAAKEHGAHLPMNTDFLQAEWLSQRLAEKANVLVWPVLSYGHYPAFSDYPGSVSLSAATFENVVEEILISIKSAGVRSTLVLNTGLSTIAPLERVVEAVENGMRVKLVNVYQGARYLKTEAEIRSQPCGSHAGELETSIMLVIAPDLVDMSKARPWVSRKMQSGPFSRDPSNPNYSPDGVYGDPTLATKEKGEKLLAAMLEDVLDLCSPWFKI